MIKLFVLLTVQLVEVGFVFAQTSAAATDPAGWLTVINVGLAGIGLVAFVKGWIVSGRELTASQERERAKDEEIRALRAIIDDKVIPELVKSRDVGDKMINLTEDFLSLVRVYQKNSDHHG